MMMTTQRTPRRERISYYRDCSAGLPVWCYAMTVDGEHDHADTVDDVDGSDTAASVAEALAARWPGAEIVRVEELA